jgi:hypothetical protein
MGQTSSHKHIRHDFIKNANLNNPNYHYSQSSYANTDYGMEDMMEDEGPMINSKNYVRLNLFFFHL